MSLTVTLKFRIYRRFRVINAAPTNNEILPKCLESIQYIKVDEKNNEFVVYAEKGTKIKKMSSSKQ